MNKLKFGLVVALTALFVGCQNPTVSQRVTANSLGEGGTNKVLYLTHVDSIPRTVLDTLALAQIQSNISTNSNVMPKNGIPFVVDPSIITNILDSITTTLTTFSNNAKDVRVNTATRSVEIYIKGYDLQGTNIENITRVFRDITAEKFPAILEK